MTRDIKTETSPGRESAGARAGRLCLASQPVSPSPRPLLGTPFCDWFFFFHSGLIYCYLLRKAFPGLPNLPQQISSIVLLCFIFFGVLAPWILLSLFYCLCWSDSLNTNVGARKARSYLIYYVLSPGTLETLRGCISNE